MDNSDEFDDLEQTRSSNGLFSMSATENAEVVNPGVPLGGDGLWSVSAKAPAVDDPEGDGDGEFAWDEEFTEAEPELVEEVEEVEGEIVDEASDHSDDFWDSGVDAETGSEAASDGGPRAERMSDGDSEFSEATDDFADSDDSFEEETTPRRGSRRTDSVGSVFTAEPIDRSDEVVDEPDDVDDDEFMAHEGIGNSLFSSGGTVGGVVSGGFAGSGAPYFTPAGSPSGSRGLWEAADDPAHRGVRVNEPLRNEPLWEPADEAYGAPGGVASHLSNSDHPPLTGEEDSPGYEAAILKLHPQDRERSSVALSVAGALLREGEPVLGVVTGQMLGRPAAVVVTTSRVLVVNDRRWQPVVDIYEIAPALRVRGRHDRNVAALSFSNDWSLSMVDGITEVSLAMELAEQIRVIADE